MLTNLGLDPVTESVYRWMLANPAHGPVELGAHLQLTEEQVQDALDQLSELSLVRNSAELPSHFHAISPHLGMEILLARQQAELAAQQQRVEAGRAAAAELISEYAHEPVGASGTTVRYLDGVDSIREYLEFLNSQVEDEFLTFAPGGAQTPANMRASRPLNQRLLERGVRMRTLYLDSIRRDPPSVEHANWLVAQGAQIRTAPSLPNRMIICDRRIALVASDSDNTAVGAVVLSSPGIITALCALFEREWSCAEPLSEPRSQFPGELTRQQTEALHLLAHGSTDESIAKRLGVSTRTARRIATGLMAHLDARSRFQAGAHAVQRGYLPASPQG